MSFLDHIFFLILAVAYPIASYISFKRLLRRIAAGQVVGPTQIYRSTLISHWTLFGMVIAIWLATGRSWVSLGFGWDTDTGFLLGLALTAAAIVVMLRQYGSLDSASEKTRESLRRQIDDLEFMMPRNSAELRRFYLARLHVLVSRAHHAALGGSYRIVRGLWIRPHLPGRRQCAQGHPDRRCLRRIVSPDGIAVAADPAACRIRRGSGKSRLPAPLQRITRSEFGC